MKDRKDAIGFVFSGGGLQGIAHIGAITALYELGIRPEYVSGTSSGSIMAMLVAMGLEPKEMHEVAKNIGKFLPKLITDLYSRHLRSLSFIKKFRKTA